MSPEIKPRARIAPPAETRTHAETQAQFHAGIWSQDTPGFVAPEAEPDRRFAVYRNNVLKGLGSALEARFPVIMRLVGSDFFAAMGRVFAGAHPPEAAVLHEWGSAFPAFLEQFEPVAKLPYLPDIARLELARGRAYHAADHIAADPAILAVSNPSGLCLQLAPSVELFESRWPAVTIWQMNQPGAEPMTLPPGPEYALIARGPDLRALTVPLDAPSFAMLKALQSGQTLGEAAALSPDPTQLLSILLGQELVTSIEEPKT